MKPKPTVPAKPSEPAVVKPKPTVPEPPKLNFATHILPIFKSKCITCHGDPLLKGDLDLRTLATAKKGGDNGPGIVAKDLMKSLIWVEVERGSMPPSGKEKLTPAEVTLVRQWISSGAN